MGSLRSLRTGHTNYLPRFEVPPLTQGTSEEMEVWVKRVWQSKLLETLRKHSAFFWEVSEFRIQFGDVIIQPTVEQQIAWIEELKEQGYLSISQEPWRFEGLDIYSPKKLTGLEQQIIETLDHHRYLKGITLLKRFKADPQQIEDTVCGLCQRGLVKVNPGAVLVEFADVYFSITNHGHEFATR